MSEVGGRVGCPNRSDQDGSVWVVVGFGFLTTRAFATGLSVITRFIQMCMRFLTFDPGFPHKAVQDSKCRLVVQLHITP